MRSRCNYKLVFVWITDRRSEAQELQVAYMYTQSERSEGFRHPGNDSSKLHALSLAQHCVLHAFASAGAASLSAA